jgi:hypothetical protein
MMALTNNVCNALRRCVSLPLTAGCARSYGARSTRFRALALRNKIAGLQRGHHIDRVLENLIREVCLGYLNFNCCLNASRVLYTMGQ